MNPGALGGAASTAQTAVRERESTMRYNLLGKTGLFVSELCLGTMTFGGKGFWEAIGKLGTQEVEAIVGTSLDSGVNFIDTADVYSEGESEKLLGAALKALGRPRDQLVVATKVRGRTGSTRNCWTTRARCLPNIPAGCSSSRTATRAESSPLPTSTRELAPSEAETAVARCFHLNGSGVQPRPRQPSTSTPRTLLSVLAQQPSALVS
jgi:hypothetical protein